ncbi:MAG: hypothetical protein M3198_15975 [Actinomycetota bacterium]|nr:hypothetical protein [Actinomycetota bacterium]
MASRTKPTRLSLAISLALVMVAPQAAAGGETFSAAETARTHRVDSSARETRNFWSEGRMRAAESNDLDSGADSGHDTVDESTTTAPSTTIEPTGPSSGGSDEPRVLTSSSQETLIPYTLEKFSSESGDSHTTEGRIFFRSDGVSYSCSGTVVTSANKSVVWTAGHCVNHGGSNWANKWVFVPGYEDGEAPYGKWTAARLAAPRGWTNRQSSAYDIGAAILHPNGDGERIADVVGSQGIAWNLSRKQQFSAYGYPSAGSFDGESLWACHSRFGWSDPIPGPNPLAIGCNMTYGSSGGGWIVELESGSYLNSVTSYSHPGERHVVYGPYFGDAAASLYSAVNG